MFQTGLVRNILSYMPCFLLLCSALAFIGSTGIVSVSYFYFSFCLTLQPGLSFLWSGQCMLMLPTILNGKQAGALQVLFSRHLLCLRNSVGQLAVHWQAGYWDIMDSKQMLFKQLKLRQV